MLLIIWNCCHIHVKYAVRKRISAVHYNGTSSILRKGFLSVLSVNATNISQVRLYRQIGIREWFGITNRTHCEKEGFDQVFIFYASAFETVNLWQE
jgi:hypothetical protein